MKNKLWHLIKAVSTLMLFYALLCGSCNSSVNEDVQQNTTTQEQAAFNNLNASVEKQSEDFFHNRSFSSESRKSFWSRLFNVVWSDASTTIVTFFKSFDCSEALVAGGGASLQTVVQEIVDVVTPNLSLTNLECPPAIVDSMLNCSLSSLKEQSYEINDKNIGLWHNILVLQTIKDGIRLKDDLETISFKTTNSYGKVHEALSLKGDFEVNEYQIQIYHHTNHFFSAIYDEDPGVICDNMINKYDNHKDELEFIKKYYYRLICCGSLDEINELTDMHISTVDNSDISETSKAIINIHLSVAKNSATLWSLVYDNIEMPYLP